MQAELKDQIHFLMERGIQPVSAEEVASRARARTTPFPFNAVSSGPRSRRTVAITAGVAGVRELRSRTPAAP